MIQVINRALTIIEFIASTPGTPKTLTEIANHAGINQATCAHIVKTLVSRNYLEQVSRREGYIIGPMFYSISSSDTDRKHLAATAGPLMEELSKSLSEDTVLSIFQNNTKFVIYQAFGEHEVQLKKDTSGLHDIYQTATGRLLLAYLDRDSVDKIIEIHGEPGTKWPGAETKKKLFTELEKIKEENHVTVAELPNVAFAAEPVFKNGKAVAALGVSIPKYRFVDEHREKVLEESKICAREISSKLNSR